MIKILGKLGSESAEEHVIQSTPLAIPGTPRPFLSFKPVLLSEGVTEPLKERFLNASLVRPAPADDGSVGEFGLRGVEITSDYDGVALILEPDTSKSGSFVVTHCYLRWVCVRR